MIKPSEALQAAELLKELETCRRNLSQVEAARNMTWTAEVRVANGGTTGPQGLWFQIRRGDVVELLSGQESRLEKELHRLGVDLQLEVEWSG